MARLTVSLDDDLLADARRLIGAKTKRETIEIALKSLVRRYRTRRIRDNAGQIPLTLTRSDLRQWREQVE